MAKEAAEERLPSPPRSVVGAGGTTAAAAATARWAFRHHYHSLLEKYRPQVNRADKFFC